MTRTYGRVPAWWQLYREIAEAGPTLRQQLAALVQASHRGAHPAHVEAVRDLLWSTHPDRHDRS